MTVTNKNIVEKWDEIEGFLDDATHATYAEFEPSDFTNPDFAELYEPFIKDVNAQLKDVKKNDTRKAYVPAVIKVSKPLHSRGKKDRKKKESASTSTAAEVVPTATAVENASASEAKDADIHLVAYGKGLLVYGAGTKAIKDELAKIGGFWCSGKKGGRKLKKTKDLPSGVTSGWTFLAEDKEKLEKLLNREKDNGASVVFTYKGMHYKFKYKSKIKLVSHRSVRSSVSRRVIVKPKNKKKVLELPPAKKMLALPPWKPEKEKKSTKGKKTTTKRNKREKVGESPNWYKTMRTFVEAANRTIPTRSVRKMLSDLQDRFDAKRNLTTPHISVLRDIQDKLIPYANKKTEKVKLPAWKTTVSNAKAAMRTINVDGKAGYGNMTAMSLAGFESCWRLDYKTYEDRCFDTLSELKAFVKSLRIDVLKRMTRDHVFGYYSDKNGEITKVCNFHVTRGERTSKVVFDPVERY